ALPNGQTWSDDLEQQLGRGYAVINHGVPGYSSVENLLQTLFYLDTYGVRPHCAVYLGWNDIRNAHLPNLDPAYANFHLLTAFDIMVVKKNPLEVSFSPLARIVNRPRPRALSPEFSQGSAGARDRCAARADLSPPSGGNCRH